jgi:hypothetical protein
MLCNNVLVKAEKQCMCLDFPETLCCYYYSLLAGGAVERLRAEQTALSKVVFSWDPPTYLPARGYQFIQLIEGDITETVLSRTDRSHTLTFDRLVDVSVVVRPISIHYTSVTKSVNIRVRGERCSSTEQEANCCLMSVF